MTNDDGLNGLVSAGAVCGVMWCDVAWLIILIFQLSFAARQ